MRVDHRKSKDKPVTDVYFDSVLPFGYPLLKPWPPMFLTAYPPYELELTTPPGHEQSAPERFLVAKGRAPKDYRWTDEPELFIKFAVLPSQDEEYVAFVTKYGLLGIEHASGFGELSGPKPEDNMERLGEIRSFHRSFKDAFDAAQTYIRGDEIDSSRLEQWLNIYLLIHVRVGLHGLGGGVNLIPRTVAGALTLQLYHFLRTGKKLKTCELPGCLMPTARKRFCSDKHLKLFHTWKGRGKIVEVSGVWEKVEHARLNGDKHV